MQFGIITVLIAIKAPRAELVRWTRSLAEDAGCSQAHQGWGSHARPLWAARVGSSGSICV